MSFAIAYQLPQSGIPTTRLVRSACLHTYDTLKEAAIVMEWDFPGFSRAINGLAPLDLNRLALLPIRWWFTFVKAILVAKLTQWETESAEERKIS